MTSFSHFLSIGIFAFAIACLNLSAAPPAPIEPDQVAIVYRLQSEESQALAINYARARGIPSSNLIALELPDTSTISRSIFNSRIRKQKARISSKPTMWSTWS